MLVEWCQEFGAAQAASPATCCCFWILHNPKFIVFKSFSCPLTTLSYPVSNLRTAGSGRTLSASGLACPEVKNQAVCWQRPTVVGQPPNAGSQILPGNHQPASGCCQCQTPLVISHPWSANCRQVAARVKRPNDFFPPVQDGGVLTSVFFWWGGAHPAQPQHTNHCPSTPTTGLHERGHERYQRPQRPTESSDPMQHAKGRTGDCPGPRKETTTRRNVTQGGRGFQTLFPQVRPAPV